MKQILELPLQALDIQSFSLPLHSKVLCAQIRFVGQLAPREQPFLYVLIDIDMKEEEVRTFAIIQDDTAIPNTKAGVDMVYIATLCMIAEDIVLHLFEMTKQGVILSS